MIIAVTSMGQEEHSPVCPQFGRTPFFVLYDTDKDEFRSLANPGYSQSNGAGPAAAGAVINNAAEIVITGRLGDKAEAVLKKAGIRVIFFSEDHTTVSRALELIRGTNA